MIVAVPTQGQDVVSHWGHAPQISLYRVPSPDLAPYKQLSTDQGCACKSGLAQVLHGEQVTHVLVGQIGAGAFNALGKFGISVIRGVEGSAVKAVESLAQGSLVDSAGLFGHEDCSQDQGISLTKPLH